MKYLLILLITLSANVFAGKCPDGSQSPACQYPGEAPDFSNRYTVGCTMVYNESGATSYNFAHGNFDYAQAGQMMLAFQNAQGAVYAGWVEAIQEDPSADSRLIDWVGRLEADLMKKGINLNE